MAEVTYKKMKIKGSPIIVDAAIRDDKGRIISDRLDSIPTSTNDLVNDSGFITENDIPAIPTDYVVKNTDITAATKTKITYDAKGLVTAGEDLIADDIPALPITKITNLETTLSDIEGDITALQNTFTGIEDLLEAI